MVCFDERPCQLLAEARELLPTGPRRPERRDHEYERRGTAHVLMAFEPPTGWRRASVTERRRNREFAEEAMRRLAEEDYPEVEKILVVLDNLSTHSASASCEAFPAEQARNLARRVGFVYKPVRGSWLDMARWSCWSWSGSASEADASRTRKPCGGKRWPGARRVTERGRAWSGASQAPTPGRSFASSTRPSSLDAGLGQP